MRGSGTILSLCVALAGVFVVLSDDPLRSNPLPPEAVASGVVNPVELPEVEPIGCGCECGCDECPLIATDQGEPSRESGDGEGSPSLSSFEVGSTKIISGRLHRLVEVWEEGGETYRRYVPTLELPASVPSQGPASTGSYDGVSQWTYPGRIDEHLLGGSHGLSPSDIAGKTKRELEAMHDALHNGGSPGRLAPMVRSSGSNCPGGFCPTPTNTRRGSFRGWRVRW